MNQIVLLTTSMLIGVIGWGLFRILYTITDTWIKWFWAVVIFLLLLSTQLRGDINVIVMGCAAGMAIYEHLYQRWKQRRAKKT